MKITKLRLYKSPHEKPEYVKSFGLANFEIVEPYTAKQRQRYYHHYTQYNGYAISTETEEEVTLLHATYARYPEMIDAHLHCSSTGNELVAWEKLSLWSGYATWIPKEWEQYITQDYWSLFEPQENTITGYSYEMFTEHFIYKGILGKALWFFFPSSIGALLSTTRESFVIKTILENIVILYVCLGSALLLGTLRKRQEYISITKKIRYYCFDGVLVGVSVFLQFSFHKLLPEIWQIVLALLLSSGCYYFGSYLQMRWERKHNATNKNISSGR